MNPRVEAAGARMEQAQQELVKAVQEAYPPGTIVRAELGETVVTLRVDRVDDCWWSAPGRILGINVKTGKLRQFYDFQVVEVVSHDADCLLNDGEGQA